MTIERDLAGLAARQHGVLARWQLADERATTLAIRYRVRCGRLAVLYPGVYAYGHTCLTPPARRLAAALAYGPTAVVSHRSAAAMWGLLTTSQRRIDVTVPGTSRRSRRGIHLHRTRELRDDEVTRLDAVPLTSVAWTLCDLASVLNAARLRRALEQADRLELLDFSALHAAVERRPKRRGAGTLRRLLAEYRAAPMTRSDFERDVIDAVVAVGMPMPLVNSVVAGYEVDLYWPQWRLVIELDGRSYHSSPRAFEADPVRDARLQRANLRVLRVTWRRFYGSPRAVLADIRALAAIA